MWLLKACYVVGVAKVVYLPRMDERNLGSSFQCQLPVEVEIRSEIIAETQSRDKALLITSLQLCIQ